MDELAKAILSGVPSNELPSETDKDGLPVGAIVEGTT